MTISSLQSMQNVGSIGSKVNLKVTDSRHIDDKPVKAADDDVAKSFADMLNEAVGKTNNLQIDSEDLTRKMIAEPEAVSIHSVMIAQQKAEIALTFAKSVRDEAIRSYRELMNLR